METEGEDDLPAVDPDGNDNAPMAETAIPVEGTAAMEGVTVSVSHVELASKLHNLEGVNSTIHDPISNHVSAQKNLRSES